MTITNGYCTLSQLKRELTMPAGDLDDDARLELAIGAASRQIDAHTGRRFWQDATVVAREYVADDARCVYVPDDISTTTGLIVKVDTDGDGTYETTLSSSDYRLLPTNAADMIPVQPFTRLVISNSSANYFPVFYDGQPGVQVTAKFGWPAVPDDVTKACVIQATQLFKASAAVFGAVQFADAGIALRVRSGLNPMAEALLEPYCLPRVA